MIFFCRASEIYVASARLSAPFFRLCVIFLLVTLYLFPFFADRCLD